MGVLVALCGAPAVATAAGVELRTLSNRADLISGGDALVEVLVPASVDPAQLRVSAGDRDVTPAFAVRDGGRLVGLVTGLPVGATDLTARLPDGTGAAITIVNHPLTGPVFSGPQTQPWRCDTETQGLGKSDPPFCMAPAKVEFFYRSTTPGENGWLPYDPRNPPADVAQTTTDQGRTVPFVVRQEVGTVNRAIYSWVVLWDPSREWSPTESQPAWNGKLLFGFGGGAAMSHRQGTTGAIGGGGTDPTVDQPVILGRGFAIASQSLGRGAINTNDVTSAETTMMVKERIVETVGPIRYTIGQGCSGGSINQSLISAAYPGLLDATQPACSYQDWFTTGVESADCHLLVRYFNEVAPHLWANPEQRAAASGQILATACPTHTVTGFNLAGYWWDPKFGCHEFLNGMATDTDQAWIYRPQDNPTGVRCTLMDDQAAIFGQRPPGRWGPVEKRIGRGFAPRPLDNVGVQYGLKAVLANRITAEQFVDLNEKIGGIDIDFNHVPQRMEADPEGLEIAFRTGRITSGNNWGRIPIMDQGSLGNAEIHTDVRGRIIRARLRKANGHADNHVIWNYAAAGAAAADEAKRQAFEITDRWLAGIESDSTDAPLERKVVRHRPAEAVDKCLAGNFELSSDEGVCRTVYPWGLTPRMAAGGPLADDVFKCQLRPLDRDDYNGVTPAMTGAQFERLKKAFPDGVCDWSREGVGYSQNIEWMSFANGPGGTPLGDPPRSRALGKPATASPPCASAAGFRSVAARPRGRGLHFDVDRLQGRPFTVEVFQQSTRRRVIGDRRVARFTNVTGAFGWTPRRVSNGHFFVRYTMRLDGRDRDVRRVALRRVKGRFRAAPDFYQRTDCGAFRAFKLSSSVFGGASGAPLGVAVRLAQPAASLRVEARVGKRVVRRWIVNKPSARRTFRFRLPARLVPPGRRVIVRARLSGRTAQTLYAQRL